MAGEGVISLDQWIPQSPARVWRALTDPSLLARWWAAGDISPVPGHRFNLDMGAWGNQPCRVLEVDPGKSISYTFAEGALDTIISWTLEPDGTGTRLHLVHSGFDLDSPDGRVSYAGMGRGWPGVVERIAHILEASGPGDS